MSVDTGYGDISHHEVNPDRTLYSSTLAEEVATFTSLSQALPVAFVWLLGLERSIPAIAP